MYRLTVDFDADPADMTFLEAWLRIGLQAVEERFDIRVDHHRIDLIPQEPEEP